MASTLSSLAPLVTAQRRIATPLGPLLLARTAGGLAGAWFADQRHHPPPLPAPSTSDDDVLDGAEAQLDAWFAGRRAGFDLPLAPLGSDFQRDVWKALLAIPRGATVGYGELARRLGRAHASRAVGAAVGRNPLSVIVPCHRVVGADGSLTGYAGGLDRKTALLRLEAGGAWRAAA